MGDTDCLKHRETLNQKKRDRETIYRMAVKYGDKDAMKILRDEYGYIAITIKGKVVLLGEV